jgi:MFS family permease
VESLFGPTFPDLRLITGENLETASWLVTITASGFLIGSGVTGLMYDKYDKLVLVIGSIIGTAVTMVAVPWCTYFWFMMVVKCISGMFAAGVDTGEVTTSIKLSKAYLTTTTTNSAVDVSDM